MEVSVATLIRVDGTRKEVHPVNGVHFRSKELVKLLGGRDGSRLVCGPSMIEGVVLFFLEQGPESLSGLNTEAMLIFAAAHRRMIYGDAVLGSDLELSCPEDHDWITRL